MPGHMNPLTMHFQQRSLANNNNNNQSYPLTSLPTVRTGLVMVTCYLGGGQRGDEGSYQSVTPTQQVILEAKLERDRGAGY